MDEMYFYTTDVSSQRISKEGRIDWDLYQVFEEIFWLHIWRITNYDSNWKKKS